MSVSLTLLYILSGVCLLLWGLRMVKRSALRGFSRTLQDVISKGTGNRFSALLSGLVVTMFLQSSTATALLTSSFVGRGLMSVGAGIAVIIGADIGTSFMAQLLSFRIDWLAPSLLAFGIIFHLGFDDGSNKRYIARILIGLGFMLLSLSMIREAAQPLVSSDVLPLILKPLENEPVLAVLVAALITYMMHSSLSAILFFATLALGGVFSLELALLFVAGANVGGAIVPLLAVLKDTPQALQIPLANLMMRLFMAVVLVLSLDQIQTWIQSYNLDASREVIFAHMGFNVIIACVFLPFVTQLQKLTQFFIPPNDQASKKVGPKYLDKKALETPSIALSCALRETLHIAELLESMLQKAYRALQDNDDKLVQDVKEMDEEIDDVYISLKNYIIKLSQEELDGGQIEQSYNIVNFATNLEHCGDIIDKSLMELARKKIKNSDHFSEEGFIEITSFHKKVLSNLKKAQSLFLSSDQKLAKKLLKGKRILANKELEARRNHIERLRLGNTKTLATSELHTDVVRDYRRINAYISSIAYEILEDE